MQPGGTWNLKPYSMAVAILYPPQKFNDNSPLGTMWVLSYDPNRDRERDRRGTGGGRSSHLRHTFSTLHPLTFSTHSTVSRQHFALKKHVHEPRVTWFVAASKSFASFTKALACVWLSWRMLIPFVHWRRCGVLCWMRSWSAVFVRVGYLDQPPPPHPPPSSPPPLTPSHPLPHPSPLRLLSSSSASKRAKNNSVRWGGVGSAMGLASGVGPVIGWVTGVSSVGWGGPLIAPISDLITDPNPNTDPITDPIIDPNPITDLNPITNPIADPRSLCHALLHH